MGLPCSLYIPIVTDVCSCYDGVLLLIRFFLKVIKFQHFWKTRVAEALCQWKEIPTPARKTVWCYVIILPAKSISGTGTPILYWRNRYAQPNQKEASSRKHLFFLSVTLFNLKPSWALLHITWSIQGQTRGIFFF